MPTYDIPRGLEETEIAVAALVLAEFEDVLEEVADYWVTQNDPLDLPPPISYQRGHNPDLLNKPLADYPIVVTLAMEQNSQDESGQWDYGTATHSVMVDSYVASTSETTCNKLAKRFAQAVMTLLHSKQRITEGIICTQFVPLIEITEATPRQIAATQAPSLGLGNTVSGDLFYVQVARVTVDYEARL